MRHWKSLLIASIATFICASPALAISPILLNPLGDKTFSHTNKPFGIRTYDTGDSTNTGPIEVITVDSTGNPVASGGTVSVVGTYNTTPPTLTNGQTVGLQVDQNGNLKTVNGATPRPVGQYNSTPQTYTTGSYVPPATDVNGNLNVNIISNTANATSGRYSSPLPTYTPGAVNPQYDQNGLEILSPRTIIADAPGVYQSTPDTLVDTQRTQLLVDPNGRARVTFDSTQPVRIAPSQRYQDRSNLIVSSTIPQIFADVDEQRAGFYIQNQCATPMWLNLTGNYAIKTGYPAIMIAPGNMYESPVGMAPTQIIYVYNQTGSCGYSGATY